MYVVGKGPNAIIWNYDVYGFDAGMDSRTSLGRREPELQSRMLSGNPLIRSYSTIL